MKDWRSWAWLSTAIIIMAFTNCQIKRNKCEMELRIKAMEKGYEVGNSGWSISLDGEK